MYKKKEIMYLTIIAILFIIGILIINKDGKHSSSEVISKNKIIINIDGEIARKTTIEYQEKTTYGTVFINVKNLLNEYSDLSKFNFYESIDKSMVINIPTLDINNNYNSSSFININTATPIDNIGSIIEISVNLITIAPIRITNQPRTSSSIWRFTAF